MPSLRRMIRWRFWHYLMNATFAGSVSNALWQLGFNWYASYRENYLMEDCLRSDTNLPIRVGRYLLKKKLEDGIFKAVDAHSGHEVVCKVISQLILYVLCSLMSLMSLISALYSRYLIIRATGRLCACTLNSPLTQTSTRCWMWFSEKRVPSSSSHGVLGTCMRFYALVAGFTRTRQGYSSASWCPRWRIVIITDLC